MRNKNVWGLDSTCDQSFAQLADMVINDNANAPLRSVIC